MLIALLILYGLVSGYQQGQIMIQPGDYNHKQGWYDWESGVRSHRWFSVYHIVDIAAMMLLLSVGDKLATTELTIRNFQIVAGALFLAWECRELAYNYARYNKIKSEHFVLLDVWDRYLTMNQTIILHIGRVLIGLLLLATGGSI